jgi:membrane-associated phospholipid phosphatase
MKIYNHLIPTIRKGIIILLSCLIIPLESFASDDEWIEKTGDVLQIALPVAAGATTLVLQDWEGTAQFAKTFGASWATVYGLKVLIGKMRPASENRLSHPSGHTMGAFAGAAFLDTRYGHAVGIPAYALAAFTGYSRVYADKHFFDDVVSGASISMLWTWFFTTPYKGEKKKSDVVDEKGKPHWSYNWEFGPALLIRNEIKGPAESGTLFDLNEFEKVDDPTTTSAAMVNVNIKENHDAWVILNPFEARDEGRFKQDVNFGGQTFPADTLTYSAWRLEDLRIGYQYSLPDPGAWDFKFGASIAALWTSIKLQTANDLVAAEIKDFVILPLLRVFAGYKFSDRFTLSFDIEGMQISTDRLVDSGFMFNWNIDRRWAAWIGYRFYDKDIKTDDLFNQVSYNALGIGVGHTF